MPADLVNLSMGVGHQQFVVPHIEEILAHGKLKARTWLCTACRLGIELRDQSAVGALEAPGRDGTFRSFEKSVCRANARRVKEEKSRPVRIPAAGPNRMITSRLGREPSYAAETVFEIQ